MINALRHAQASRVDIAVEGDAQRIRVTVADDGVGLPADWARPGHFGLRGLADRVAAARRHVRASAIRSGARRSAHGRDSACGAGMIRVLLVDDHAVVRTGFRLLLQSIADLSVVAEADSGEAACQLYAELDPDVVVMDIAMPGMGGLEALRRIRARHPQARVLTLSAHDDPMHARRCAFRKARSAFCPSAARPRRWCEAVTAVAAGRRYLDAGARPEARAGGIRGRLEIAGGTALRTRIRGVRPPRRAAPPCSASRRI